MPATEVEPMLIVVPSHTGCTQCGRVGLLKERDARGLRVDAWWVTEQHDRTVNHGPFCSDYCAAKWAKEN